MPNLLTVRAGVSGADALRMIRSRVARDGAVMLSAPADDRRRRRLLRNLHALLAAAPGELETMLALGTQHVYLHVWRAGATGPPAVRGELRG